MALVVTRLCCLATTNKTSHNKWLVVDWRRQHGKHNAPLITRSLFSFRPCYCRPTVDQSVRSAAKNQLRGVVMANNNGTAELDTSWLSPRVWFGWVCSIKRRCFYGSVSKENNLETASGHTANSHYSLAYLRLFVRANIVRGGRPLRENLAEARNWPCPFKNADSNLYSLVASQP